MHWRFSLTDMLEKVWILISVMSPIQSQKRKKVTNNDSHVSCGSSNLHWNGPCDPKNVYVRSIIPIIFVISFSWCKCRIFLYLGHHKKGSIVMEVKIHVSKSCLFKMMLMLIEMMNINSLHHEYTDHLVVTQLKHETAKFYEK